MQEAKGDLREASLWYEDQQSGLGRRFLKVVKAQIKALSKNPKAIAIRYDNMRCTVLNVFPYMVHFFIDEENKTLVVSAVFHTSRNPEALKSRNRDFSAQDDYKI